MLKSSKIEFLLDTTFFQNDITLDLSQIQHGFIERVELASGKPVILQSDPEFAGHATIKIARDDQPAHLLLYKQEHDVVLPYLVAFQCLLALRTIEADSSARFDLSSMPSMTEEVLKLTQAHAGTNPDISEHAIPQLASQLGNGIGLQLRSFPISLRVDRQIFEETPQLQQLQRKSVELQIQEAMHALSPQIKKIAPPELIKINASMSSAYTQFWANLWEEPSISTPFTAAGYQEIGETLNGLNDTIPNDPNHDRKLVDGWAKALGIDRWYATVGR